MDLHFIWKAIVVVLGGVLILRLAGRKSISQLTVAQAVMMVAVGSLIIEPVGDRNIWITLVITLIMVLTLISIEYLVLRKNSVETFIYGKSVIVVENGEINQQNLKKLRLTVDMLEVRLRQQSIQNINDLQWATIESNGQLGYELKPSKQPATKEDIQLLMSLIQGIGFHSPSEVTSPTTEDNIFKEVKNNKHKQEPPENLK